MSSSIERVHYYEREYLRSFDFTAEQSYHLEMRRRLNLALHRWGLVDGLDVIKGELVPGAPEQFHITPGMAIDGYGREIFLPTPIVLDQDVLLDSRVNDPGTYGLWIAYHRRLATPPEAGYRLCDVADQYTRWRETCRVLIAKEVDVTPPEEPGLTDALPDDPESHPWPMRVGSIDVVLGGGGLEVQDVRAEKRLYIGLRTQRLGAATATLPETTADAALPILVEDDLRADKNVAVGQDFPVDAAKVEPAPADPPNFPGPSGNLKTNNLFLLENLYSPVGGQWLGLKELIQSLMPEMRIDTRVVPLAPAGNPSNGVESFTVTSQMPSPGRLEMFAAISGVVWENKADLDTWYGNINQASAIEFQVNAAVHSKQPGQQNVYDVSIDWNIGPRSNAPQLLAITSLQVSYIAVFYP